MSSNSLAGAISKMFSGTLVSRILGQVRLIVLVAALGTTAQADAFMVANTLPNTIYNLIAGGVLNAILVPQVVRAMKRPDGDEYVNRLLTVAGVLLLGATVVLTSASTLLVTLYASQMAPEWFALAVAFAFWCIPQVFFYGLYTLLGNVLNARGSFGPYMWAPVVNNVVAIAGLFAYIWLFGSAASGSGTDPADWTGGRIAMIGGFATLGVVIQALVLIVPLRRSGFRFRPRWGLRGSGLGGASRMAMWTFGALLVGQVGYLMLTNVAAAANGAAGTVDAFVPTNTAYAAAFSIYMLPQSLITTSLVTALFTRMSAHAAAQDGEAVRADMSFGMRVVGVFTVFAAAALCVLAIPVVQAVIPTASPAAAVGFAAVLVALSLGIPAQGVWTIDQRVSYAYEDARTLFRIQIPMAGIVVAGGFLSFLAPPQWWVPLVSGASALSLWFGAVVGYLALRTKLPSLDGSRVFRTYFRLLMAVLPPSIVGWVALHFWGPVSGAQAGLGPFVTAVIKVLVIGSLMAALYVVLLRRLGVEELDEILTPVRRALGRFRTPSRAGAPPVPTMGAADEDREDPDVQTMKAGERLDDRFRTDEHLRTTASGARLFAGWDEVLDRPVTILATDGPDAPEILDAARRAALIDDNRFTRIIEVEENRDGISYIVAEAPAATSLDDLAGRVDGATARAIIGETAAALEAARRRGVHHCALDPSLVTVTDEGGILIAGLAYLAVAELSAPHDDDPVETSLARSRADAVDLVRLQSYLLTGSIPEQVRPRANVGEVMRSLTPWGDIVLSGATRSARPPSTSPRPPWHRVRDIAEPPPASPPAHEGPPGTPGSAASPESAASVPDTSRWTLRPAPTPGESVPTFTEVVDAPAPESASSRPSHATMVAWWRGLRLPTTLQRRPPGEAAPPEPLRTAVVPPPPDAEPAVEEAPPPPPTTPEDTLPEEAPAPAEVLETPPTGPRPSAPMRRTAALASRAAAATASLAREGGERARAQAEKAFDASVKVADVSLRKIDSFVARHDLHVPGELEDENNAALPFSQRRVDPGPFVIAFLLLLITIATIAALLNLATVRTPTTPVATPPVIATTPPAEGEAPADDGAADVAADDAADVAAAPVVASIGVLDPQGDGEENPDLTARAMDGDPATYWRSRSYVNPAFGMKQGIGLDVQLTGPATVTEVELTLMGNGGHVQVKTDAADPVNAPVLAEADMGPTTVITLPEPTTTSRVVLWFTSLPVADSDGKNRVELAEVVVR